PLPRTIAPVVGRCAGDVGRCRARLVARDRRRDGDWLVVLGGDVLAGAEESHSRGGAGARVAARRSARARADRWTASCRGGRACSWLGARRRRAHVPLFLVRLRLLVRSLSCVRAGRGRRRAARSTLGPAGGGGAARGSLLSRLSADASR